MKIYYGSNGFVGDSVRYGLDKYISFPVDLLISFYGSKTVNKPVFCQDLFVDSGAFSAFKQNKSIDINKYIAFIHKYSDQITAYPNLDIIGDPVHSLENQKYCEAKGLHPIPCYHYGEDKQYLTRYCREYNYIALGGMVPIAGNLKAIVAFLDFCWQEIFAVHPDVRVHGFGINDTNLMKRYPWFSIDASSIHTLARYGGIMTPWGSIKINKNVSDKFALRNQELIVAKVTDWVQSLRLSLDFDAARQETPEATLMRVAISVTYYEQIKTTVFSSPFTKQSQGFGL